MSHSHQDGCNNGLSSFTDVHIRCQYIVTLHYIHTIQSYLYYTPKYTEMSEPTFFWPFISLFIWTPLCLDVIDRKIAVIKSESVRTQCFPNKLCFHTFSIMDIALHAVSYNGVGCKKRVFKWHYQLSTA